MKLAIATWNSVPSGGLQLLKKRTVAMKDKIRLEKIVSVYLWSHFKVVPSGVSRSFWIYGNSVLSSMPKNMNRKLMYGAGYSKPNRAIFVLLKKHVALIA